MYSTKVACKNQEEWCKIQKNVQLLCNPTPRSPPVKKKEKCQSFFQLVYFIENKVMIIQNGQTNAYKIEKQALSETISKEKYTKIEFPIQLHYDHEYDRTVYHYFVNNVHIDFIQDIDITHYPSQNEPHKLSQQNEPYNLQEFKIDIRSQSLEDLNSAVQLITPMIL
jgi:hypothetical protein